MKRERLEHKRKEGWTLRGHCRVEKHSEQMNSNNNNNNSNDCTALRSKVEHN